MLIPQSTDVLVVGAGPAGAAAAAWCARAGLDVVLADQAVFPRDKACGDGLTPRAIAELNHLGMQDFLSTCARNQGLRATGFGRTLMLPWPDGHWPTHGGASPRKRLDNAIRDVALAAGVTAVEGARAVDVHMNGNAVAAVTFRRGDETFRIEAKRVIVADGAKSSLGRSLGRQWHRETVYGVAARAYIDSGRSDDEWISSHLELRDADNKLLSGYGWVFPLADGGVNIGVGTLATAKRPADINLRQLLNVYVKARREEWQLRGEIREFASAPLPMGGAVSNVAGRNWLLIGDAAACVNPLNGEGIDYGLETGRLAAELLQSKARDFTTAWPEILFHHYGSAFSIARRLGYLLTVPGFLTATGPVGMRSTGLMTLALRWMGNLVDESDRDVAGRIWHNAGKASLKFDVRKPFGVH